MSIKPDGLPCPIKGCDGIVPNKRDAYSKMFRCEKCKSQFNKNTIIKACYGYTGYDPQPDGEVK